MLGAEGSRQTSEGRLRVAFVINSLHRGGAEMVLLNLLKALGDRIEARVYSLTSGGDLRREIEALEIEVRSLPLRPLSLAPASFFALRKCLRDFRPDLVHTWMYHSDLVGGVAARAAGVDRVVWGLHHTDLGDGIPRTTRILVHLLARLSRDVPTSIQSCSHRAAELHIHHGYPDRKVRVIPNGVDPHVFAPSEAARRRLRAAIGVGADAMVVGAVGRFHPQKDHRTFCEAARELHRALPDAHFVLIGLGLDHENPELTSWIRAAGLEGRVRLLGPRRDIPKLMPGFDVYTSTSRFGEAFPVVLLEAMASGVPCVATDVGDSGFIIGDTGYVVPPGDVRGIADGWYRLLTMPTPERARLRRAARERVATEFTWTVVGDRFLRYYQEVASD